MLSVIFAGLFALLIGALMCFMGYRVFLVLLPVWGFFAGLWLGAEGVTLLFGTGFLATTTGWAVGFVLGLILALLSYLFYFLGVAIIAAAAGYALGSGLMLAIGFDPGLISALVGLVVAVVVMVATLALNLQKYIVIILTSFGGANAMILGLMILLGRASLQSVSTARDAIGPMLQDSWFWAVVWLLLTAAGVITQIRSHREYVFDRTQYVIDWG